MHKVKIFVLLSVCVFASALNLGSSREGLFYGNNNIELVMESNIGGTSLIASQLISLEFNKVKNQVTTFSPEVPAFDVVADFTNGTLMQYFNLTGECNVYEIPKMCLTAYMINLFENHTEFVGQRGQHLELYEMKYPEDPGSRLWLYGVRVPEMEGKGYCDEGFFIPTRFQTHRPSEAPFSDYSGDFLDIPSNPYVTNATFHYPACEGAEVQKLDAPFSLNLLGMHPKISTQVVS